MANKRDVSNAFYEGICTAISISKGRGADAILAEIDHNGLGEFLTGSGMQYAYLFTIVSNDDGFVIKYFG